MTVERPSGGYSPLHHDWVRGPLGRDGARLLVWVWIWDHAAHEPTTVEFQGSWFELGVGQMVTSRGDLMRRYRLKESQVRSALKWLRDAGWIATKSTRSGTVVTVLPYEQFSLGSDRQLTGDAPAVNRHHADQTPASRQPNSAESLDNSDIFPTVDRWLTGAAPAADRRLTGDAPTKKDRRQKTEDGRRKTEEKHSPASAVEPPPRDLTTKAGCKRALPAKPGRGEYPPEFAAFWSAYPSTKNKAEAYRAWRAAVVSDPSELETIQAGAERYATTRQGEDPRFTPHASTWIRGRRWEDEAPATHDDEEVHWLDREIMTDDPRWS